MFLKALLAFIALPCLVAGVIPVLLGNFDPWAGHGYLWGWPLAGLGALVLLRCVWDFYKTGEGTLAHWTPARHLVTVGLYRYTRNPMYIGVLTIIGGLAIGFGSPLLGGYLLLLAPVFHLHIVLREEPWLARQFPKPWRDYSAQVSRWLPRLPGAKSAT